jgi:hypothetical protein
LGFFYPNKGNFIAVVGNINSRRLAKEVVTNFRKSTTFPVRLAVLPNFISGVDFSDHWSFWQAGYPAVMVTDTAFLRYRHYHRDSDTYEKVDYDSMAEVVKGIENFLLTMIL